MEALRQLQQNLPPFLFDVFRLAIWLLLLLGIFVPLERFFALRRQKVLRKAFVTDLAYYFLNSLLPRLLLVLPISMVAMVVHQLVASGFYSWQANMPLWLRFLAALTVGEVGSYWGHRWMHEIPVLWRFHAIHHSAEEMDWLVNTRAHPLDMVFTRLCGLLPIYGLGLAQPTGNELDTVPMLYVVVGTAWSFFIHANVRWRFGWLEWLISTPAFHHWHHTKDGPAYVNRNYAAIFPCVDWLFGTSYLPAKRWPGRYGIDTPTAPGLLGQLLQPFVRREKSRLAQSEPASQAVTWK
ncbi:sterol desaturase family protein [Accumulibacter sp.]|uniref:sterol desaturase family protein n=1 Tax=Accumulibacter sp. TaxID=2053492 RepID=UPI0025E17343|nr:sterol desaturase family protein [Accumulibacter sp.]MCP5229599.1 sterol desaturase family protein [Accumulibacter sp.]